MNALDTYNARMQVYIAKMQAYAAQIDLYAGRLPNTGTAMSLMKGTSYVTEIAQFVNESVLAQGAFARLGRMTAEIAEFAHQRAVWTKLLRHDREQIMFDELIVTPEVDVLVDTAFLFSPTSPDGEYVLAFGVRLQAPSVVGHPINIFPITVNLAIRGA